MKEIKKSTLTTIILILFTIIMSVSFTACDYAIYNIDYELIEIDDAYEQGLIDYDDLLNIAYICDGYERNKDKFGEEFIPTEIGELTKGDESAILESLVKWFKKKNRDLYFKEEDFVINGYYGVYKGYIAFTYKLSHYALAAPLVSKEYTIEGINFEPGKSMFLWKKK